MNIFPGQFLDAMPGGGLQSAAQLGIKCLHTLADKLVFIAKRRFEAIETVADVDLSGRVIKGDDGKARGQGFQGHIAEGFGQAGKQEDIGRRIMVRQVNAGFGPAEPGFG